MAGGLYKKKFGFLSPRGSPHVSRTIMLAELETLFERVPSMEASKAEYLKAILDDNCLGKRTEKNRAISKRYLVELYSLDAYQVIFRALRIFWNRDAEGRRLLALLCAYARDPLLRASAAYILPLEEGARVDRESMEVFLDKLAPGRYSPGKLASNAKNLNSTWTQSGHLVGRSAKKRSRASPTPGSLSYALLLGYLTGGRGEALMYSEYVKLLDCTFDRAIALAEEASRRGWIIFKRIGDVIEVSFPNLLTSQEIEWLHEQG